MSYFYEECHHLDAKICFNIGINRESGFLYKANHNFFNSITKGLEALNTMVQSNTPFLLSLVAEEVGAQPRENATSTAVDVAIIVQDQTNDPPQFSQKSYVTHLAENAPVGTALYFGDGQLTQVTDRDQVSCWFHDV